jgi:hypothetical protein
VLIIFSNNITDISPLENLTSLTSLYLQTNYITDISPLVNLTSLTELYLFGNDIANLSPIKNLTSLEVLIIFSNNITDISPLEKLTSLTWIDLESNNITDISPLSKLSNLTYLNLRGNPLTQREVDELQAALPDCSIGFTAEDSPEPAYTLSVEDCLMPEGDNVAKYLLTVDEDRVELSLNVKEYDDVKDGSVYVYSWYEPSEEYPFWSIGLYADSNTITLLVDGSIIDDIEAGIIKTTIDSHLNQGITIFDLSRESYRTEMDGVPVDVNYEASGDTLNCSLDFGDVELYSPNEYGFTWRAGTGLIEFHVYENEGDRFNFALIEG